MTRPDHHAPLTARVPVVLLVPMMGVIAAIYPAIWNPLQPVRRVALTIIIIGLVSLVFAAVATVHRWVADITDKIVDRQVRQMRSTAIAQLDSAAEVQIDAAWDEIVHRFTSRSEQPESK